MKKEKILKVKKSEIKYNKPKKSIIDIFLDSMLGLALTATGGMVFLTVNPSNKLPNKQNVYNKLKKENIETDYLSVYDNYDFHIYKKVFGDDVLLRLAKPLMIDKFIVNINFETTDKEKEIFLNCIEDYNSIFEVINPNYKFEIDFNPNVLEKASPYSINIKKVEKFKDSNTLGRTINFNYPSTVGQVATFFNTIQLKESLFENEIFLKYVFKHEFMHVLGLGDAYLKQNNKQKTIMDNNDVNEFLTKADLIMLDALYRSADNKYSDDEIEEFINKYVEMSEEVLNNRKKVLKVVKNSNINKENNEKML